MFRLILIVTMFCCSLTGAEAQWRHFSIYVNNDSNFDINCLGKTEKGQGIFAKYNSTIKAHQKFLFVVDGEKSILPKGVEGSITITVPGYDGHAILYFDNPASGSPSFQIQDPTYPLTATEYPTGEIQDMIVLKEKAVAVRITVDTTHDHRPPVPLPGSIDGKHNPIPPVINFEWQVDQRMNKDEDDDDKNNGKAYSEVSYYFTTNGDYAAIKREGTNFSLMVYSKDGQTWMIDDKKKTITVMNMPKMVGEGGMLGKQLAEEIKKAPLTKDRDDEKFTITKSGKTKIILGNYTAEEYIVKNNKVLTSKMAEKTGTLSLWYVRVPFDPVKIYTMGAGRPADLTAMQNNPRMKNNMAAIPVLNKNYLWVETWAGGKAGLETTRIEHKFNTIYTAGYTIKVLHGLKDALKGDD
jgi:hypothetical protein